KKAPDTKVEQFVNSGNSNEKIDLVFLPEGYTPKQMDKFRHDVSKTVETMFKWHPYNKYKEKFNIWAVMAPSEDEGTDIPGEKIWKNTVMNSHFYTFGSERYLTVPDIESMRNLASNAPYDHICVMVNSEKYGGCGLYNYYTLFTVDNEYSEFLFHHEFGHGFAGLADEYYTSSTAYNSFFNINYEPTEPNISTLVNFDIKWKDMVHDTVQIPTVDTAGYSKTVGVYEGAGYSAEGIYRPYIDCTMKSKSNNDNFCPVCRKAIRETIEIQSGL
ncbi:MAG: M64 family metallopeptidase, partial [Bacteroidales bacterium]|nr:M64 family metallopeptidase [Bacteroidales bacterium]